MLQQLQDTADFMVRQKLEALFMVARLGLVYLGTYFQRLGFKIIDRVSFPLHGGIPRAWGYTEIFYPRLEKRWKMGVGRAGLRYKWRSQSLLSPKVKASWSPAPKEPEAGTGARACSGKGQNQGDE